MANIFQFLQEVKVELSRVVWPKVDELIGSVVIVLILVVAFSLYLGAVNYFFGELARKFFF